MKIKKKPEWKIKTKSLDNDELIEAVKTLEIEGRFEVNNVIAVPEYKVDVSKTKGKLVDYLISKGYTYFKKPSNLNSYPSHFDYVFYGPQVKVFLQKDTILSMFNSDEVIELESELEYQFLVDVVKFRHTSIYSIVIFPENELKFPLTVELVSKKTFDKKEFIIQEVE